MKHAGYFLSFFVFGTGVVGGKNGIKKRKVFERLQLENDFQQKEDHKPPTPSGFYMLPPRHAFPSHKP